MLEFIDTNVVLRYLMRDPPEQALRARALIESERPLVVTDVVLAETAYALRSSYGTPREDAVDALVEFVRRNNITVHNLQREIVVEALLRCRPSGRVSFGDALIWAAARCSQPARLYSFDQRFPALDVEGREP